MSAAKPHQHAFYRGDVRGQVGVVMGPTLHGEFLHVVSESYDPGADRTRLGFDYGPTKPGSTHAGQA